MFEVLTRGSKRILHNHIHWVHISPLLQILLPKVENRSLQIFDMVICFVWFTHLGVRLQIIKLCINHFLVIALGNRISHRGFCHPFSLLDNWEHSTRFIVKQAKNVVTFNFLNYTKRGYGTI